MNELMSASVKIRFVTGDDWKPVFDILNVGITKCGGANPLTSTDFNAIYRPQLKNHFSYLNPHEVSEAFDMFVNGKLDYKAEYRGFSSMFLANILQSYSRYRNSCLSEMEQYKQREAEEQPRQPMTREQNIEWWKKFLLEPYKQYLFNGEWNFKNESVLFTLIEKLGIELITVDKKKEMFAEVETWVKTLPEFKMKPDPVIECRKRAFTAWIKTNAENLEEIDELILEKL